MYDASSKFRRKWGNAAGIPEQHYKFWPVIAPALGRCLTLILFQYGLIEIVRVQPSTSRWRSTSSMFGIQSLRLDLNIMSSKVNRSSKPYCIWVIILVLAMQKRSSNLSIRRNTICHDTINIINMPLQSQVKNVCVFNFDDRINYNESQASNSLVLQDSFSGGLTIIYASCPVWSMLWHVHIDGYGFLPGTHQSSSMVNPPLDYKRDIIDLGWEFSNRYRPRMSHDVTREIKEVAADL